ncbi:MAG: tetratricopeptide repeat protein [Pirellulales bacterium]|nr:tetratricopeptide repeat protein [Pirellulales bacterium]
MMKIPLPMLIALPVALMFSIGPLVLAGNSQEPGSLAVAPFGWNRVVVVHAITALPLSWILSLAASRAWPMLRRRWTVLLWTIAGVDIAGLTIFAGNFVSQELAAHDAGSITRLVLRITWCLLLQIPWCLAALAMQKPEFVSPADSNINLRYPLTIANFICWSLVVAIVIPISFVNGLTASQATIAREHWRALRIEKARQIVLRLFDVGSTQSLGSSENNTANNSHNNMMQRDILSKQALKMLNENVEFLSTQIKALRAGALTESQQLLLGKYYAALDRNTQACEMIELLAHTNAEAAVTLGEIEQRQGHWQAANQWFIKAIDLARQEKSHDPDTVAENKKLQTFAYDALARGARELKQFEQAEAFYHEAIEELPNRAAHFHAQLALHCDLGGRPAEAIVHQLKAHELDPNQHSAPASLTTKIFSNSTPVGIFAPAASNND